jgi:hypothetical protein
MFSHEKACSAWVKKLLGMDTIFWHAVFRCADNTHPANAMFTPQSLFLVALLRISVPTAFSPLVTCKILPHGAKTGEECASN